MNIAKTEIYRYSIPMVPFTIATGTMHYAQNIFLRIFTDKGITGVGECSAFPMITGETQSTCFEMAKDFALLWKNKNASAIEERMNELHAFAAFNNTIKSAFDMALFDIAAQHVNVPLYKFLGGNHRKELKTDVTVGINTPHEMAAQAKAFVEQGVEILKIKLGKKAQEDIERIMMVVDAVGNKIKLRIDANQGWTYDDAVYVLTALGDLNIAFCEQPMRKRDDHLLPQLKKISPVKIMADESVFDHYDAIRLIKADACEYVNIKFAKSGGILEAQNINAVCEAENIPCMMGGMLESRVALTAFAHFATAFDNIKFYDMDTCMLGHKVDPVIGGITYNNFCVELNDAIGIGAEVDENFLETLEKIVV
jgi:L-alanine-DL-glutamate epimerase-like enolase superfamily enzyme